MKSRSYLPTLLTALAIVSIAFQSPRNVMADQLTGAWQMKSSNEEQLLIFMDDYFTHTTYDRQGKKFIQTSGGTYSFADNKLFVQYEFDTKEQNKVGQTLSYEISLKANLLSTNINAKEESWTKVDDGSSGLAGLWKITARKQGDALQPIHQTGTRKTVKILTSTRFQWAAIDPGTKSFMGTGGGTYTFKDGKYTENIEFFSRDSSRVGSSLSFDGKLENGDWHHSGLSSRGEPIYEVWSRKK